MRVLLIDDNAPSVEIRAMLFRTLGHEVYIAHTGAEGLAMFGSHPVDVTVLDLGLPDMSGEDVLRGIRSERKDARVIVLSGRLEISDYVRVEADAVVIKGSGTQGLIDALVS